jgi:cobalt-zinc-cadmium efflux system outer membrane protein
MKRFLFSSLLLSASLSADGFEKLLEKALSNSPYLHASQLDIEVQKQQNERELRYKNPSLGVDIARFNPDAGEDKNGYSLTISQPIRLWGIGDDKEALGQLLQEGTTLAYTKKKARFIKALSLAYIAYSRLKKLEVLSLKEQKISKQIYQIASRRFRAGSIAKKELLHAQTLLLKQEVESESISLEKMRSYYDLLALCGVNDEIKLDGFHTFALQQATRENPELIRLKNSLDTVRAKAKITTKKIENIQLNANYEKEYEQDISSLGLSVPLAIFNTKSQEQKIASLEAKQLTFKIEQAIQEQTFMRKKLSHQREKLKALRAHQERLIKTQQKLLMMYQEGYKIAKSNLLELQNAKSRLLDAKKRAIELDAAYQQNIIETNYLRGVYHD